MNQTTNFTQWKNLTPEQKTEHNFENYKYEYQTPEEDAELWRACRFGTDNGFNSFVYRLVIEPDKWYYLISSNDGEDILIGSELLEDDYRNVHPVIRPAKPSEIPQPDKIAEWLDANVWDGDEASKSGRLEKHEARFSPQDLYDLVKECMEDIK